MEAYTSFAEVYDLFMEDVPYEAWADYLHGILADAGIDNKILLDLGCGTGKMTRLLAGKGYDMIGVDSSAQMLQIAKEVPEPDGILYLLQDMREFELYGTVGAVVSVCDCLNYILEESELLAVFRLVNNYLDPKGLFIFDMNTPYKYEELLAGNTFAENREEGSFIWENGYDGESGINEYALTLYIGDGDGTFSRFQETHYQRCYTAETVRALLCEAGMEVLAIYDAYTKKPLGADSERMTVLAREKGK